MSRPDQLARMVETFESIATTIVNEHGGRVIKTIGDEILFVADDPEGDGADRARPRRGPPTRTSPSCASGAAYGGVLAKLGDVFGPTVNVASRLTSLSRPGKILVDRGLSEALDGDEEFRVRRSRNKAVRGYSRLETYTLKRPRENSPSSTGRRDPRGRDRPSGPVTSPADVSRLPRTLGPGPVA